LIFSFSHAEQKHTHLEVKLSLAKTLYLPLSKVAVNLCRFNQNRINTISSPNHAFISLVSEGFFISQISEKSLHSLSEKFPLVLSKEIIGQAFLGLMIL
jgi:hypothetical protein